jgi:hypothetical protein
MAGLSDYTAEALGNWVTGQVAMPALPAVYMALFTTMPTNAGASATEVSGGSYARVQVAGAVATSASSASGTTLTFTSVPSWVSVGMTVRDATSPSVIPSATTVSSKGATTVVISNAVTGGGVGSGDTITFSSFAAAAASSGSEPATVAPVSVTNTNVAVTFATSTASWGTVVGAGLYDASTSGNLLDFDWLGNYHWLPFSCTSASPGVLTVPAHGYSNADQVVVTAKDGGTLPTTGGNWAGLLTVANVATDTFTAGVNTTGTGDGLVRKVASQVVSNNVTFSISAGNAVLTFA